MRQPSSGDAGPTTGTRMSIRTLKTAKFKDIEDELIMPAEPDWKTRTFIFDSNGEDIDSNITINVMHWSGETFTFSDVHWRDRVKVVKKRIRKPKKTSSYDLLFNGKTLKDKKSLFAQGVQHKSFLVMQQKKQKTLENLPQVTKINFGADLGRLSMQVGGKMTLRVKHWKGKTFSLSFDPTEYADDIKDAIYKEKGIPVEYQLLTFEGRPLDDTLTLMEMKITQGSTLCLEKMKIKIDLPTKGQLALDVDFTYSIRKVKKLISKHSSYEVHVQCLVDGGEMLENSKTLLEYNIQHSDVLKLETFEVSILSEKGDMFPLPELHPQSTVGALKDAIFKKKGVAPVKQQLKLQGQMLNDSKTLLSQGINHKSIVMLEIVAAQNNLPQRERVTLSQKASFGDEEITPLEETKAEKKKGKHSGSKSPKTGRSKSPKAGRKKLQ